MIIGSPVNIPDCGYLSQFTLRKNTKAGLFAEVLRENVKPEEQTSTLRYLLEDTSVKMCYFRPVL